MDKKLGVPDFRVQQDLQLTRRCVLASHFHPLLVRTPDLNTLAHPLDAKSINANAPYEVTLWLKTLES